MASVADASDDKRAGEAPVTPHEIGVPSDSCVEWVKEAAASLDQNGFCVLRSPTDDHLLSAAAREACAADAVSKLTRLLDRARALGIDPKRIMGSLWAHKIAFDAKGNFEKLKPRWCVKGYDMDKNTYVGFAEVAKITSAREHCCRRR